VRHVWRLPPLRWVLHPARTASVLRLRWKPHGDLQGRVKWKELKASLAKEAPKRARNSAATRQPAPRKLNGPGPLLSRWTWARGGITLSEGACCQGHHNSNPKSLSSAGHEGA
jgi:hypothetical protein